MINSIAPRFIANRKLLWIRWQLSIMSPDFISRTRARASKLTNRFGREASLVLLARVLQNANGFLLSVLIVRRFGLTAAGTLTVATVATVVIALLGTFGLTYVFARTDAPIPVKNSLGITAALAIVPISLPFIILLGLAAGRSPEEAAVIVLLSLSGPFFAQANIANALQVLQGKASHSIIPPAANLIGLIAATAFGSSYLMFALLLAVFRFSGTLITFLCLPRAPIKLRLFATHVREGARFLTGDIINLGTDQLTVLLASYLMSRTDLGLFGLCRQMLTVSDTPGWSQMQAKYFKVVADPEETMPELRRLMLRLGLFCGATAAMLSIPLGLFVFHLPAFMFLAPLLLMSVPLRYLLSTYDLYLRAIGAVGRINGISLIRAALALLVIPGGAWLAGALGAVLGTIAHTAIAAWLTSRVSAGSPIPLVGLAVAEGPLAR
jgi:O-antigen/teichoic acid export membrane protein